MKKYISVCAWVCLSILANNSKATTYYYWDPENTATPTTANLASTWSSSSLNWSPQAAGAQTNSGSLVALPTSGNAVFCAGSTAPGAFTVTVSGTVNVGGIFNGELNPPGFSVTLNGGTLSFPSGAAAICNGGSDGDGTTINSVIAGTGAQMVIEGDDFTALYGVNTYTGGTQLGFASGYPTYFTSIVYFNNSASFGASTGTITLTQYGNGGALVAGVTNAITIPNPVTLSASTTNNFVGNAAGVTYSGNWSLGANVFNFETGNTAGNVDIISGIISGTAGFTVSDAGTLKLTGVNTYTGNTTNISPAVLVIAGAGQLGSGFYAGNIVNGGSFTYNSSASQTLSGVISGAGTVTQAGSGRVILSGLNTYTGVTTISGGILQVDSAETAGTKGPLGNSAAANPGSIVMSGGTLQYSSANDHDYSGRFSTAANQQYNIDVNGQTTGALGTALTSSGGSLTLSDSAGGGILALSGANTYTGNTTINAGTISINGSTVTPFGATNGTIKLAGGNIIITGDRGTSANNINNPVVVSASSQLQAATTTGTRNLTFGGSFTGTGGTLTVHNTEVSVGPANFSVRLTNAFTFAQPIVITTDNTGNFVELAIWNSGSVGDQIYNGIISGNGAIWRSATTAGTGARVIFNAANTYTGGLTNNDGEVACGISSAGPADSPTSGPLGTGPMTVGNSNAKLSAFGSAQTVGNHVILSASPLTFTGTNALTMSGNFDFGSVVRILAVTNTNTITLSGSILNGGLTVSGGQTLTLSGSNAYTGVTTVSNNSTLALASTGSISNSSSVSILAGSTLDVSAIASFSLSSSTSLSASGTASAATINGALGGTVSLGSQHITLAYDGSHPALSISQGTLVLNSNAFTVNGSALPVGDYTIASQASGNISSSGSFSASGTAIGAGTVGSIVVSNGNVNLIIHTPPVAGTATYQRTANSTLIIPVIGLLTNATATNGGTLSLVSVSSPSTNGATVSSDANNVYYVPPSVNGNVTDAFLYTVSDSYGFTNQGTVVVTVMTNNNQSVNITGMTTLGDGTSLISFAGIPGYTYLIEATTNLTPTIVWTILSTNTAGTNGLFQYNDLDSTNYATRYYRTATP